MPPARTRTELGPAERSEHLAAIVESSDDAILSKDPSGVITSWNPAAERMYGYTADEAIGSHISMLIPPDRRGEEQRILERIRRGERIEHYDTERVTKAGGKLKVSLTVSPIRLDSGAIVGAAVIARDVTGRHRTLELAEALQEVTAALTREITTERILDLVLGRVLGVLGAQAAAVGVVEGDDVVLAGSTGYTEAGLANWDRFPLATDVPMTKVIRSGEPLWSASADDLRDRFPALGDATILFNALAVLPLTVGEAPYGAISLSFDEARDFDPEERAFLAAVIQQTGYALGWARMYEQERLVSERQTFLAEAGELLAQSLDPDTALRRLAGLAVQHIADWCGVDLVDESGGLRHVAVAHIDAAKVRLADELRERYPVDETAETGVPNVIRTGRSELHSTVPDELLVEAAQDEEHLRLLRELGLWSAMIVPLKARDRVLGAITLVASDPGRRYGEADVALAEDLARTAALAIDNALLFRREHEAALTLQRSLLPTSLPQFHEGIEFAARYRPAAPGLEVGGDWYEVAVTDDGTVGVTIGDVAGRGIRAAAVMGRIRPALRAYVLDGHGPEEALRRLDRLMKEQDRPEMTTVFHLHFDPVTSVARYVRAGHPPALMRRPDGEVVELGGSGTPPVGILEGIEFVEHEVEVTPGSLLLLYTDGLIERRHVDLLTSLGDLKAVFRQAPQSVGGCLDWLEDNLSGEDVPDDVAMLAMSTPDG